MSNDVTKLLKACVEYRAKLDKLEAENAERGLRLVTIEEIIYDHRSDAAKVLALKWMLGRKEAQP